MAEPAPPAPTSSARRPAGSKPAARRPPRRPSPSVMSPCQVPSALRRRTLADWSKRARSVAVAQWRKAANLCGTVATMPSRLRTASAPRRKACSDAPAGTCAGSSRALRPRAAKAWDRPPGAFTCAIGSPKTRNRRVAPSGSAGRAVVRSVTAALSSGLSFGRLDGRGRHARRCADAPWPCSSIAVSVLPHDIRSARWHSPSPPPPPSRQRSLTGSSLGRGGRGGVRCGSAWCR